MKRYIALSVNDNPGYLIHVPLVCWAWRKLGWEPILFYRGGLKMLAAAWWLSKTEPCSVHYIMHYGGYRSDTITQISRLYAGCVLDPDNDYVMTGDIDMLPLSDYWNPDYNKLSVWGHDLTNFNHYPICYIGMMAYMWRQVMILNTCDYNELIKRDLDVLPQAKENYNAVKRWVSDQDLITERINKSGIPVHRYNRGSGKNGYPVGRIDRSAWNIKSDQYIDCHMFQDIHVNQYHYNKTLELLRLVWPKEDFGWYEKYVKEFKALL